MINDPLPIEFSILRGASVVEDFERRFYPYEVISDCGKWVNACTGQEAPDSDAVLEDYTGCSAIGVLVPEVGSTDQLLVLSTDNNRIILDGAWMRFRMSKPETLALQYGDVLPAWQKGVAFIFVTRPSGVVEPQYFLSASLLQGTPTEPAP